jgi:RimJ/RimL family protein N-acetyltransferase
MFRYLHARGIPRAICEVHPDNHPSNRASEAAGMRICRRLHEWIFLKRLMVQRCTEPKGTRWRAIWI